GVVVLAAGPGLTANALPLLLVVGAAFAFAMSNVLTKRYGPFDPLMLMGWSSLLTVPQVTLMSLLFNMDNWRALSRRISMVGWHSPTQFSSAESLGLAFGSG